MGEVEAKVAEAGFQALGICESSEKVHTVDA